MTEEYVSAKDRILSAAIDIISEAGLKSLTTKSVSMRTNISESMIYRYYQSMDELLVDVVGYYFHFDQAIFRTVKAKKCSAVEKIELYVQEYAVYYENYDTLATLMLQYEELLHNTETRDHVIHGILNRKKNIRELFQDAMDGGEITNRFTSDQLTDSLMGITMISVLNRRIEYHRGSFRNELCSHVSQWIAMIRIR